MNYDLLREKFLLLDANVLINYSKYPTEMERVRLQLEASGATSVLDELVRFEYIRGAASKKEIDTLKRFLMILFNLKADEVDTPMFPTNQEIITSAGELANIYSAQAKNLNTPTVDCFLAAQMKKYHPRLMLVTSDHKDFPALLFDRIGIETVDVGTDIINIGFYQFNMDKYKTALDKFAAA